MPRTTISDSELDDGFIQTLISHYSTQNQTIRTNTVSNTMGTYTTWYSPSDLGINFVDYNQERESRRPMNNDRIRRRLENVKLLSEEAIKNLRTTVDNLILDSFRLLHSDLNIDRTMEVCKITQLSKMRNFIKRYRSIKSSCLLDLNERSVLRQEAAEELSICIANFDHSKESLDANYLSLRGIIPSITSLLEDNANTAVNDDDYEAIVSNWNRTTEICRDLGRTPHNLDNDTAYRLGFATPEEDAALGSLITDAAKVTMISNLRSRNSASPIFPNENSAEEINAREVALNFFRRYASNMANSREMAQNIARFRDRYCSRCFRAEACPNYGVVLECCKYLEMDSELSESFRHLGRGV